MPEISDADLAVYQRSLALLEKLNAKPEARRQLQNLVKQHVNNAVVTDDDVAAPFLKQIEDKIKPLVEFQDDLKKRETEYQAGEQIRTLKDRGFTPEGIEKIKAYAKDHSIPNLADAADLYEYRQPAKPVEPTSITPAGWNFAKSDTDDGKLLLSDEDEWADKKAAQVINEFRTAARNRE